MTRYLGEEPRPRRIPEPPPVRTTIPTGADVPRKHQLDLITLAVTPEEARMIATALSARELHLHQTGTYAYGDDRWAQEGNYKALRRKVEFQSGASLTP